MNMLASTSCIRSREGGRDASLLDLMKACVGSNSMRNLVIKLTSCGYDGRRYEVSIDNIVIIIIVVVAVVHSVTTSSTTSDVCLNFPDKGLEVREDGIRLQVSKLAQEGLRIHFDLGALLFIQI
jgi:hypothetical protein